MSVGTRYIFLIDAEENSVKFTLEQAMEFLRGGRGIALLFL
jgi:hypothetical protein